MPVTKVRNDQVNNILLMGVQSAPGIMASPSFRINGNPDIDWLPEVTFDDDANGTYLTKTAPILGIPANTGSWGETALSYERAPSFLRLICKSGGTPYSGSGPDYTYKQSLALSDDDVDFATVLFGTPGLLERFTDLRFSEINIAFDVDGDGAFTITPTVMVGKGEMPTQLDGTVAAASTTTVIKVTGGGMTPAALVGGFYFPHADDNREGARLITANTATDITLSTALPSVPATGEKFVIGLIPPPSIPLLVEEKIKAGGTKVYLDPGTGTIGTTQIKLRVISGNITIALNLDNKAFLENEFDRSGVFGRGSLDVTGQLRLEGDRPDEIRQLKALSNLKLRIDQQGSDLGGGVRKMFRIDIPQLNWTGRTRDTRNNNKTQTLPFRATNAALPIEFTTRNGLSVLPA